MSDINILSDLPELRAHIRARRAALAGFMEQGAGLALDGDLLRVTPRGNIYIAYLTDNRASIAGLASAHFRREVHVEIMPVEAIEPTTERTRTAGRQIDAAAFCWQIVQPGGGAVELRAMRGGPVVDRIFATTPDLITQFVQRHQDCDLFFGIAARGADAADGTLNSCEHLAAFFVDIDYKSTAPDAAQAALDGFSFQPSAIVHSGGGLHCYWRLEKPIPLPAEAERAKTLLRKLALRVGGDLAAAEPARILRVPGTFNHKYRPAREVAVGQLATSAYQLSELEAALAEVADPQQLSPGARESFHVGDEIPAGQRNDLLFRLARSLKSKRLSEPAVLAAVAAENRQKCRPPLSDSEIAAIVDHAFRQSNTVQFEQQHDARFCGFSTIEAVRDRLMQLDAALANDISRCFDPEFITAAAALEHYDAGEFARLTIRLKGRSLGVGRWERAVRDRARKERERLADVAKIDRAAARSSQSARPGSGEPVELDDPEPCAQAIDGALLAEEIASTVKRFVVLSQTERVAVTLWIFFSYLIELCDIAPRLAITSPEPRCGKSTLTSLLSNLVCRPLPLSNISAAAIYRTIDLAKPALLMDETDALMKAGGGDAGEEMRGILDSGHTRALGYVIRLVPVGDGQFEPRKFSTFTPICHALIGKLPATLADRAVAINMQRKRTAERVEKLRGKNKKRNLAHFADLRSRVARWTKDNRDVIAQAEPAVPENLNDRQADNWSVLLAIADAIDGGWGELARAAAVELSKAGADDSTLGTLLLGDLRNLFDRTSGWTLEDGRRVKRLSSLAIVTELGSMEARPWVEWERNKKPITQHQLANLLRPFGIAPGTIRLADGIRLKGYDLKDLRDIFSRYAPDIVDPDRDNVTTQRGVSGNDDFGSVTRDPCNGSKNGDSAYAENDCHVVTDRNEENSPDERKSTHSSSVEEAEIDRLARADAEVTEDPAVRPPGAFVDDPEDERF